MTDKVPEINDESRELLEYSKWLIERAEHSIEGILNRSGIILGATGIELGIIFQLQVNHCYKLITALLLMLSGFSSIAALWPRAALFPRIEDLTRISSGKLEANKTAIQHLIGKSSNGDSLMRDYLNEAANRGSMYRFAVAIFAMAQISMILLIN